MDPWRALRPLLFAVDAERAHRWTIAGLSLLGRHATTRRALRACYGDRVPDCPVEAFGRTLRNPVGLAAGLDKHAEAIQGFAALGFGFLELGTVTPLPQPGNPAPRLFRLPGQRAVINRMGFNSVGLETFTARLAAIPATVAAGVVIGVNIGKNADTPIDRAVDDYLAGLRAVHGRAGYVTVNVSSPNTRDLRQLQTEGLLDGLLGAIATERERLADASGARTPIVLKVAPDLEEHEIDYIADRLITNGFDGLVATNTTVTRPGLGNVANAAQSGGLSGAPLAEAAMATMIRFRQCLGPELLVIASGGILSGRDARARIDAGADLVQLYTGLVYRGPALVAETARALTPDQPTVP
jgi:dihydroorotate dehydrogenase